MMMECCELMLEYVYVYERVKKKKKKSKILIPSKISFPIYMFSLKHLH